MICPSCRATNLDDAKFCNQCGGSLVSGCAACGHPNPDDSKFCNACGAALSGGTSAPPRAVPPPRPARPLVPSAAAAAVAGAMGPLPPSTGVLRHDGMQPLAAPTVLAGERKHVTVMFADVSGFTSMSEKLDPEDMHGIMNRCFELLVREVHRYEGMINQFTGDGIMALFGAPVARADSPQRAVLAALSIQHALEDFGDDLQAERGITFRMRIGLNSGMAVVGRVGSDARADYTAVGDTTNLAARMEQMAEPGTILITENTHRLVEKAFECESLGERQVKGKADPVAVYRVCGVATGHSHESLDADGPVTPFAGRDEELRQLKKHVERALAGEGRVIGIMADTGMGKSRLVRELLAGIDRERVGVAHGHCLSYGAGVAYMPFADMLRDLQPCTEDAAGHECAGSALYQLVAQDHSFDSRTDDLGLGAFLSPAGPSGRTGGPKRSVFERLLHVLFEAGQQAPLLLVLEDLQWIDPTSEELLGALIRDLAGTRICLICTFTPGYHFPWADRSYYRHITLDRLSRESSAAIVRSLLGGARVPAELMTLLQDGAEGNPYYLEASVRTLQEDGFIEVTPEGVRVARPLEQAHIPDTIQDIVMIRIDRLDEPVKRTLQVAAIIGRVFEVDVLAAVLEAEGIVPALDALVAAELIASRGQNTYAFRQGVTREVAYNSLLRRPRRELHLRVGRAMEWLYGDRLHELYSRLGYHYAAGDEPERAIAYLRSGAHSSAELGAMHEGAAQLEQALELLATLPASDAHARLRVDLLEYAAELSFLGGAMQKAVDLSAEALTLAEAVGYHAQLGRLYITIGGLGAGGLLTEEEALERLKTGLKLCEEAGDEVALSRGYMHLGNALRRSGRLADAAQCYENMMEIGERHPGTTGYVVAPCMLALTACEMGRLAQARTYAEQGLASAALADTDWNTAVAAAFTADIFLELGDVERAEALAAEGLELAERLNIGFAIALARVALGRVAFGRGDYTTALKHFKKYRKDASGGFAFAAHVRLGETALAMGQGMAAYAHANDALECDPAPKDIGRAERLLAAVLLRHGAPQLALAQEALGRSIERFQRLDLPLELGSSLVVDAQLAQARGDDATADARFRQARDLFETTGALYRLAELDVAESAARPHPASVL